ncbi:glutathione S-transferase N-terminal domain-containing protein [Zooshikella harenae]|uniref:Glutathione S-transferase C-terminal domain-containing protein n=1 Tax=Zooshikella harenae TaxID=2827238 RepID=A0ABS5ZIY0_9GAMM|nr:glutathione S-transferase N-terminal domain-containing protein [Zooshikella harenae]MBU2714034.1 glutathione S-transferase C-terminal domain-containing protein [Zooshikella harenae]
MQLFTHTMSVTAFTVRLALKLKQVDFEQLAVPHLTSVKAINAPTQSMSLPLLQDYQLAINQPLAILEYLDEKYPRPPLLPEDIGLRARVRAFAHSVIGEVYPLANHQILNYLSQTLLIKEQLQARWLQDWLQGNLQKLNQLLEDNAEWGPFCFGYELTLADIALIPQLHYAQQLMIDLSKLPILVQIYQYCMHLNLFQEAINSPSFRCYWPGKKVT